MRIPIQITRIFYLYDILPYDDGTKGRVTTQVIQLNRRTLTRTTLINMVLLVVYDIQSRPKKTTTDRSEFFHYFVYIYYVYLCYHTTQISVM